MFQVYIGVDLAIINLNTLMGWLLFYSFRFFTRTNPSLATGYQHFLVIHRKALLVITVVNNIMS